MLFQLTNKQLEKIAEWRKSLEKEPKTAIGGAMTYSFTPTSIGVIVKVIYFDGSELDITEYEYF